MISAVNIFFAVRLMLDNKAFVIVTLITLFYFFNTFLFTISVFAQNLPTLGGVAVNVEINDSDVQVGNIISATKDGFKKSSEEYDVLVFGVVVNSPIISVEPRTDTSRSVISSGETLVLVSNSNGDITEGDLITTSTNAGIGQKATAGGYVIGKALQSFNNTEPGLISVLVGPSFGTGVSAGGIGSLVGIATNPENSRYVLASILGILMLIGGIYVVSRLVSTGVIAIGRNPLAKSSIYRSMIITGIVFIILAIAGIGVIVAILNLGG